jgi:hypothetical protein
MKAIVFILSEIRRTIGQSGSSAKRLEAIYYFLQYFQVLYLVMVRSDGIHRLYPYQISAKTCKTRIFLPFDFPSNSSLFI